MVQREHRERANVGLRRRWSAVRGVRPNCWGKRWARRSLRFSFEDLYGPRAGGACSEFGFLAESAVMSASIIFAPVAPIWEGGFPRRGWTSHLVQDLGDLTGVVKLAELGLDTFTTYLTGTCGHGGWSGVRGRTYWGLRDSCPAREGVAS